MVKYGYAKKSSKESNDKEAEIQLAALLEAGISPENIYVDNTTEKEKYKQLINCINPGDVLVVKSLHQLGYTYSEIATEWKTLTSTLNAHVQVLDIRFLDTSIKMKCVSGSFISDLFVQIISFAAQREKILNRQKQAEGIASAKSKGKHLGRPLIPKPIDFDEIYDMWRAKKITFEQAMARLNLKRSTFERFIRSRKEELKAITEK